MPKAPLALFEAPGQRAGAFSRGGCCRGGCCRGVLSSCVCTPSHQGASRGRRGRLHTAKPISAFDGDDEDEQHTSTMPEQQPAGPGPSSIAAAAAAWVEKGSAAAERGDSGVALGCWDQALLLQPEDGRVHEMRAQVLNAEGRTYEVIQAAQQAVTLRPDWPDAHITLARVQLNLGEPLLALSSYQAAAKLQPDHPDLAVELPTAQMYAKRHAQQQKQQPGSRAHVVQQAAGQAGAAARCEGEAELG